MNRFQTPNNRFTGVRTATPEIREIRKRLRGAVRPASRSARASQRGGADKQAYAADLATQKPYAAPGFNEAVGVGAKQA